MIVLHSYFSGMWSLIIGEHDRVFKTKSYLEVWPYDIFVQKFSLFGRHFILTIKVEKNLKKWKGMASAKWPNACELTNESYSVLIAIVLESCRCWMRVRGSFLHGYPIMEPLCKKKGFWHNMDMTEMEYHKHPQPHYTRGNMFAGVLDSSYGVPDRSWLKSYPCVRVGYHWNRVCKNW